jgi:hypothetical protein
MYKTTVSLMTLFRLGIVWRRFGAVGDGAFIGQKTIAIGGERKNMNKDERTNRDNDRRRRSPLSSEIPECG